MSNLSFDLGNALPRNVPSLNLAFLGELCLRYLGAGFYALGILAVLMIAPLAAGMGNQVLQKIRGAAPKDATP
jgi:hypothetical protein